MLPPQLSPAVPRTQPARAWAAPPRKCRRPLISVSNSSPWLDLEPRSLMSKAARSAGPLINAAPSPVAAAEAPMAAAASLGSHQGSGGGGGGASQPGPCLPSASADVQPSRGLVFLGTGLWQRGAPLFTAGLGPQVFPALHHTVTLHQVLQDLVPGVRMSVPESGPPCSPAWATATAPVTVGPRSLVRSAQSTRGQRLGESKGENKGQLLCFTQSKRLLRGGGIGAKT